MTEQGWHYIEFRLTLCPLFTADQIEAIVAAETAAVMTDEQDVLHSKHLSEGVTCDGFAR